MMVFKICLLINQHLIHLKQARALNMLLAGNQIGVHISKFNPLYSIFLNSIKLSGHRIGIQFSNSMLFAEQNNQATKIINAYTVYHLDVWPKTPLSNLTLKNCLFGATNIRKSSNRSVGGNWVWNSF